MSTKDKITGIVKLDGGLFQPTHLDLINRPMELRCTDVDGEGMPVGFFRYQDYSHATFPMYNVKNIYHEISLKSLRLPKPITVKPEMQQMVWFIDFKNKEGIDSFEYQDLPEHIKLFQLRLLFSTPYEASIASNVLTQALIDASM